VTGSLQSCWPPCGVMSSRTQDICLLHTPLLGKAPGWAEDYLGERWSSEHAGFAVTLFFIEQSVKDILRYLQGQSRSVSFTNKQLPLHNFVYSVNVLIQRPYTKDENFAKLVWNCAIFRFFQGFSAYRFLERIEQLCIFQRIVRYLKSNKKNNKQYFLFLLWTSVRFWWRRFYVYM
jgi:hypothetical protein